MFRLELPPEHFCEERTGFRHTFQIAVVTGINAALTLELTAVQHSVRKIQLLGRRLTAGHIKFQPFFLKCGKRRLLHSELLFQLFARHGLIFRHLVLSLSLKVYFSHKALFF